jgi:hypothetical protein
MIQRVFTKLQHKNFTTRFIPPKSNFNLKIPRRDPHPAQAREAAKLFLKGNKSYIIDGFSGFVGGILLSFGVTCIYMDDFLR